MKRLFLFAIATVAISPAATIISRTSPGPTYGGLDLRYASWSQTETFTNVTVAASLSEFFPGVPGLGNAWLMTQVGAGTTAALHQVATASLNITGGFALRDLFTIPTLGPGTYYLVIQGDEANGPIYWEGSGSNFIVSPWPTVTTAPGVTDRGDSIRSGSVASFAPASGFFSPNFASTLLFTVTSEDEPPANGAVPEPATGLLAAAALAGLAFRRR
jgi:MYXO-CTERM domain-containing protein